MASENAEKHCLMAIRMSKLVKHPALVLQAHYDEAIAARLISEAHQLAVQDRLVAYW